MNYKTVFVKSIFGNSLEPVLEEIKTGKKTKSWFNNDLVETETRMTLKENNSISDSRIDGDRLNNDVNTAILKLNSEGFDIVSLTPVTSGNYNFNEYVGEAKQSAYAYGYGYSYTEGIMILAKAIN